MKDMIKTYGLGLLAFFGIALTWEWIQPKPSLPDIAPAFELNDLDGNLVALESLRGEPVVLNFWATWCGPCIREIPEFAQYARENPKVTVLGMAMEQDAGLLRRARKRLGITYPVIPADTQTVDAYDISTLPTTVVVNPDGSVGTVHVGAMSRRQLEKAVGYSGSGGG